MAIKIEGVNFNSVIKRLSMENDVYSFDDLAIIIFGSDDISEHDVELLMDIAVKLYDMGYRCVTKV